ncbi:MAG: SAM-dependent methyltransferase [Anaerolineae bacterium]|jgi:methyltransferase (TIGR00027 family)|nr:SAM-dependent methyltransferase [Anaerolineae bacterium]
MKRNQSSLSAAGIAIVRALESEKPADVRLIHDPYARRFVNGGLFHFVNFFYRLGWGERKGPGVWEFIVARERYVDDYLLARLNEGLEQLVILGAGFDARAYRFQELERQGVRLFEVDHPATQAAKLEKLKTIFGQAPERVTYVGVDFNTQKLGKRLAECGYEETRKTLFVWQGVTQYLSPEAVDDTLSFVRHHAAPGSSIIFDYAEPSTVNGGGAHGEVRSMRRYSSLTGEKLVFGVPVDEMESFLRERGFTQVQNADHRALEKLYFSNGAAPRAVMEGYAIASGVVPD